MRSHTLITLLLALAGAVWAQTTVGFSPVPIWPPQGTPTTEQAPGSYIFFDPATDEYVIHYPEELGSGHPQSGRMVTIRIELENRARPDISVVMQKLEEDRYRYLYTHRNSTRAKAPISTWALVAPATDNGVQLSHSRWLAFASTPVKPAVAPRAGLLEGPELRKQANLGKFVRWAGGAERGVIQPGAADAGFAAVSDHRPGWTTAYIGAGNGIQLPHGVPVEVSKQLEELQKPENYYSSAVTFGPKFAPADTDRFVAADWHLAVQKLASRKALDENSEFFQQVVRLLETVIHGDSAAGMSLLASPSTPLEKEVAQGITLALRLKR